MAAKRASLNPPAQLPEGAVPVLRAHVMRPSYGGEWRYPLVLAEYCGILAWFDHNGITQIGEFSGTDEALMALRRKAPTFGLEPGMIVLDATALELPEEAD